MMSAFREFATRFDPDELRETFDRNLKKKPIFSSLAKMKYWDLYCELYPIATQAGSGPFPQHMGEEFVRAYELQLAELKRLELAEREQRAAKKKAEEEQVPPRPRAAASR